TPQGFYDANGEPNVAYFQDPNINPDSMVGELDAVTRADTDSLTYIADEYIPYISNDGGENSWFRYDMSTHTLSANSDLWWILRSDDSGSFAKMNVVALDQAARQVAIDFFVQADGASGFDVNPVRWQVSLPDTGGQACYDFDAAAEVACDNAGWDLMFEIDGRSWSLWTQSEPKGQGEGGAFGPIGTADIGDYTDASAVPGFFPDGEGGVFADGRTTYNWALYAQQKMWPNYRVYALDMGDGNRYALQVTGYYSPETGTSGHYSIRYRALD
ncbi:MAG: HmuY family protein, partial [Halothiobacillaceae bacterium]